jgi:hypothetical protein
MTISPSFGAMKQFLMLRRGLNGTEEDVSRTNFWKSGAEADLDMDNGKASGTCMIENACGTGKEGVFVVFGVDGNGAALTVHAQNGGVRRINRKCSRHIVLREAGRFCRIPS